MTEISKHNRELFDRLRSLHLPLGEYAVFGSGPLGARGLHECHDLDVIVTPSLYEQYRTVPGWTEGTVKSGSHYLDNGNDVELYYDWAPGMWDIKSLITDAEVFEDLPFVRIEHVVRWKKLNGREKDLAHLKIYADSGN